MNSDKFLTQIIHQIRSRKNKMLKDLRYKVKKLKIHSDKRGWLVEILKRNELKEDIKQIYAVSIKPGKIRGDHYHRKKIEWLFLIGEKAEVYLEDLETKKRIRLKLDSKNPKLLTIFPKMAHTVKNSGKKTIYLVSAQNNIYSHKNSDTNPYLIKT